MIWTPFIKMESWSRPFCAGGDQLGLGQVKHWAWDGGWESHGPWCGAVLLPAKFLVLMDYNVRCWILDVRWHWSIGPLVHWSIVLISTHTAPVESGSNWPRPWSLWCRSLYRRLGPPLLSVSWVTWHLDSQGPFLVKMDQLHLFLPVSLGKHYASS